MRTRNTRPPEDRLKDELRGVVENLRATHALDIRIKAREPIVETDWRPDAEIELVLGKEKIRYAVEIRQRVDRAEALKQLKLRLGTGRGQGLIFTPYMAPNLADVCRQIDLQFLDVAGNAYLYAPGLHIFIKGERAEKWARNETRGGTATALRIVFALLNNPELQTATYRAIATAAGVALGAVGQVFEDLAVRGHIAIGKQHKRRILEPARLIDEWVTNYPIRLRPKLNPRRFRAPTTDWWGKAQLVHGKAWWGGEVGADRLTNYLKAEHCTIYLDPETRDGALNLLVREHRLRADPNGNVEVLDAFWNLPPEPGQPDVAPPLLVYADLLATLNPRDLEVAKLIRERFLDNPAPPN